MTRGAECDLLGRVNDLAAYFIHPGVNKFTVRTFGTEKAVRREQKRCRDQSFLVIHPYSCFKITWDVLMLLILTLNIILLPIAIAFFDEYSEVPVWAFLSASTNTVFFLDLFLNFRTAFYSKKDPSHCVLNPTTIAKNYLRTWFILDLISSLPVDPFIAAITEEVAQDDSAEPQPIARQLPHSLKSLRMLKFAKFLTLLKLLRISRIVRYASQWENVLNFASVAMRVVSVVGTMFLFAHINGCTMFFIPRLCNYPPGNWIEQANIRDRWWLQQYSWSLFRAMSHMLGIGYGQHPPVNMLDLWLVIFSVLSGATCYALFIGQATSIIQQMNFSRRLYSEKIKQVEQYMSHKKLPPQLQVRIHQYYEAKFKGKMFNEKVVLSELNDCLRHEVLNYNCRELVSVVPFFKDAEPAFVSAVVSKLQFEVYQPGDIVIQEGTIGSKMFFIQTGVVDVLTSEGTAVAQLTDGAFFGEICLLARVKRTATIRAENCCSMYSLERADFMTVLESFAEMRPHIQNVAKERLEKLGKESLTDFAGSCQPSTQMQLQVINEKLSRLLALRRLSIEDRRRDVAVNTEFSGTFAIP